MASTHRDSQIMAEKNGWGEFIRQGDVKSKNVLE